MSTALVPLDTLGATIRAHIEKGDASIEKAEQHYKSAGLHLSEAKARVKQTPGLTWPRFLLEHCQIRRARADELIMIADGRTTLADLRMKKAESVRATRDRKREDLPLRSGEPVAAITESVTSPDAHPDGDVARLKAEIEALKKKLAKAEEDAAESASLASMREVRANEAEAQRDQAQHEALFYKSDKEHLAAELEDAREEGAKLRDLVMNGGSREDILDEEGNELDGHVFVIGAAEDIMRTCMICEPFLPVPKDDSKTWRFLGMNRFDWMKAPKQLIRAMQLEGAVALWEAEWQRGLSSNHSEPDWHEDAWERLQERCRRAGLKASDNNVNGIPDCVPAFLTRAI